MKKKRRSKQVDLRSLVPAYKHGTQLGPGKKTNANTRGEPTWIFLRRFEIDRTLSGSLINECCNCGMEHLMTFNVLAGPNGGWWLIKRVYDNPDKPGRRVIKRKR